MMPITDFLSCTALLDEFESLSPRQRHHAKTYVTGLVACRNKTVTGIAREVLPANSNRALNKFLTEYDWDAEQLTHERLEELQNHGETRWSQDGYIILDDTITQKAGDEVPGVGYSYENPAAKINHVFDIKCSDEPGSSVNSNETTGQHPETATEESGRRRIRVAEL